MIYHPRLLVAINLQLKKILRSLSRPKIRSYRQTEGKEGGGGNEMFSSVLLFHSVIWLSLIDTALTVRPNRSRSTVLVQMAACAATSDMQIAPGQPTDYD